MDVKMIARTAVVAIVLLASLVGAVCDFGVPQEISASSRLGNSLLSKARRLNQDDDGYDFSWATDYSIVFHSCHNSFDFRADGGGSGDGENPMEYQPLVIFKLCPSGSCGRGCSHGGQYLVEMREFVESYLESKENDKENACEEVKENCSCDDDDQVDDDTCLSNCYFEAELEGCEDDDDGDDNFEVDKYLECEEVSGNDDDGSMLYVGAYCSFNRRNIYLGTFKDRQCSQRASTSAYKELKGVDLPYSSKSLVGSDCISCADYSNGDDDSYPEVAEICDGLYERSTKCEKGMKISERSTGGCDYIRNVLPQMERLANHRVSTYKVLTWVFLLTTIGACCLAGYLYSKSGHGKVDLSSQGGSLS